MVVDSDTVASETSCRTADPSTRLWLAQDDTTLGTLILPAGPDRLS